MAYNYGTAADFVWDLDHAEVRFKVRQEGNHPPIQCRVTREAIEDHCGNPGSVNACLDAAKEKFDLITDKVQRRIANGAFELDRSILITSQTWK